MVAIDVDWCSLVNLSGHQNDPVLESHRQMDLIVIEDFENAFSDNVIFWVKI